MRKVLLYISFGTLLLAYPRCTMCHDGGVGMKLDKLSAVEIKNDLLDFKIGKKKHSMMSFVKNMSDKEIEDAARRYGKKD